MCTSKFAFVYKRFTSKQVPFLLQNSTVVVFRNFSTGSVQKKMDESCAGGKEIENRSIASNQEDGPNHDDGEQVNKEVRPVWGGTHAQCLFAQPIAKRTDI